MNTYVLKYFYITAWDMQSEKIGGIQNTHLCTDTDTKTRKKA